MSRAGLERSVGVDLGGTSVKVGALDASGQRIGTREFPSELERGPADLALRMAQAARSLGVGSTLGLAVPGLLERTSGIVRKSPNLAPIEGYPLRDELARLLSLDPARVRFENDANAAAVGEQRAGAARGERDCVLATLGTGVGGGVVLGGELVTGEGGLAGELGHLVIDPAGPRCGCGGHGCLEQFASATAAMRRARERGLDPDLVALAERARRVPGPERELLADIGRDLGYGFAVAATLLDVRCYVVGGGFGAAFDVLRPGIEDGLVERSYGRTADDFRLLPAVLGAEAGWIGAAILAAEAKRA